MTGRRRGEVPPDPAWWGHAPVPARLPGQLELFAEPEAEADADAARAREAMAEVERQLARRRASTGHYPDGTPFEDYTPQDGDP